MPHAGTNQVLQPLAFRLKGSFHHARRLNLLVFLPAIGQDRQVKQIANIAGHVIQTPHALFVLRRIVFSLQPNVLLRFRKARTRAHRNKVIGVMSADMPRSRAAQYSGRTWPSASNVVVAPP